MKNILLKKMAKIFLVGSFLCQGEMVRAGEDLELNKGPLSSKGSSSSYVPPILQEMGCITKKEYSSLEEYVTYFSSSSTLDFAPLKLGKELFERVMLMEEMVKNSEWEIWWRATPNLIIDEFSTPWEKSFGVSILAGYVEAGWNNYREAEYFGPNSTGCVYTYYVHALLARDLLNKRCQQIEKWIAFIEKNSFLSDKNSIQEKLKNIHHNLLERHATLNSFTNLSELAEKMRNKKINALGGVPGNPSSEKEVKFYDELMEHIKKDKNYRASIHYDDCYELISESGKLYGFDTKITESAVCNLYDVFIPASKVKEFLKLKINNEVMERKKAVVYGHGESFHPRLPNDKYREVRDNIVTVYSDFSLIGLEKLRRKVNSIIKTEEEISQENYGNTATTIGFSPNSNIDEDG